MLEIFSSYDEKLQGYNCPFFMPKKAQAIRHFADGINDPSTQISKHPGDYSLICLGTFDDETGIITAKKETLCNGIDVKSQNPIPTNQTELFEDTPSLPDKLGAEMGLSENQLRALKSS